MYLVEWDGGHEGEWWESREGLLSFAHVEHHKELMASYCAAHDLSVDDGNDAEIEAKRKAALEEELEKAFEYSEAMYSKASEGEPSEGEEDNRDALLEDSNEDTSSEEDGDEEDEEEDDSE